MSMNKLSINIDTLVKECFGNISTFLVKKYISVISIVSLVVENIS